MRTTFILIFLLRSIVSQAQVVGGDVDVLDFEIQIRKILSETDIRQYKEIVFNCRVVDEMRGSSTTRLFYYFSSDSTVEGIQIENFEKDFSQIHKTHFRKIGTLFISNYESINEKIINGLQTIVIHSKGWTNRPGEDSITVYKDYVVNVNKHNRFYTENPKIIDSSIFFANGTSISNGFSEEKRINCSSDLHDTSTFYNYTHRNNVLTIDTIKDEGKFFLTETNCNIEEDTACGKYFKYTIKTKNTWQCELDKTGLINSMVLTNSEGDFPVLHSKLSMTINYSNVRTKEFCKYLPTLQVE